MNRNAIGLTLISLTLASVIVLGQDSNDQVELQPFTHVARIPADYDKGTIRFEQAKLVQVPTRIAYVMNSTYCRELAMRDPGGSMYCPHVQTGSPAAAYEITYSYAGQPLASDESGGRLFSFQVYFRPDEVAPEVQQALTENKVGRADLAGYFTVNTFREEATRMVIDEAKSHFCDGNFVDGMWTHTDASCNDEIHMKASDGMSNYITVRVDAGSAVAGLVSTEKFHAVIVRQ